MIPSFLLFFSNMLCMHTHGGVSLAHYGTEIVIQTYRRCESFANVSLNTRNRLGAPLHQKGLQVFAYQTLLTSKHVWEVSVYTMFLLCFKITYVFLINCLYFLIEAHLQGCQVG